VPLGVRKPHSNSPKRERMHVREMDRGRVRYIYGDKEMGASIRNKEELAEMVCA